MGLLGTSPSVDASLKAFDSSSPVAAVELVNALLKRHPEYGRGVGGSIVGRIQAPKSAAKKPASDWVAEVQDWVEAQQYVVEVLHGRLLIHGLSSIDEDTAQALRMEGFLKALRDELGDLPQAPAGESVDTMSPADDQLRMLNDSVTNRDALNRRPFAEILATSMDRVREDLADDESFLLHIDGPWGSGKSTLLRFLADELQQEKRDREPWVVVEFNAWRHQREDPPWWALRQAIAAQGLRYAGLRARLRERAWRINAAVGPTAIGVMVLLVGVGALIFALDRLDLPPVDESTDPRWLAQLLSGIGALSPLIMLVGVLYPLGLAAAARLAPRSGRQSEAFLASRADPLSTLSEHFDDMLKWIDRPVAIFIDDVDRCEHEYVVRLLEGIQTLFSGSKATFVVACDRRWIEASYDAAYSDIRESVEEPGRSLGHLFLAKAFQVSLELPPMGRSLPIYWARLLGHPGDKTLTDPAEAGSARDRIRQQLRDASDFDSRAREGVEEEPELAQEWQVARIVESLQPGRLKETEKALWHFHPYVERNPRAMKRLVNAFAIQKAVAEYTRVFEDTDLPKPWRQLVLWLILGMRWPRLAAAVRSHPDILLSVIPPDLVGAEESTTAIAADDEIAELLRDPDVRHVIIGEEVGTPLLPDAVKILVDLPVEVTSPSETTQTSQSA